MRKRICLAFFALAALAQQKVLTPEQKKFQAEWTQWQAQRHELHVEAQTALAAEMAREKTAECPDAQSTRAEEECLQTEMDKTQANYEAFTGAIRGMLSMAAPAMPGQQAFSGPTGTPLTAEETVAQFDKLEAESKHYRDHASGAAYNQYKGGTLAPVFGAEARQKLTRLHMQELAFIYGEELSNH